LFHEEDKPEQLMCKPRLPCFTAVWEVAAQPVTASTAKATKIRFIPVLKRLRRDYGVRVWINRLSHGFDAVLIQIAPDNSYNEQTSLK
jgi:hypothetical protein